MIHGTNITHSGMGPIPHEGGTAFRVWAPFASKVCIAGEFNGWSQINSGMTNEGNGYWYADMPEVNVGQKYKYVITNGQNSLWRIDPYAKDITNSVGDAIIHNPKFDWGTEVHHTPEWNDIIIYEMHIGTFYDRHTGDNFPGTIRRAVEKLDYLRDIGVNAIELMPIAEFPVDYSWGYNPSHIFAVEEAYGGPDGLKELIKEAHARGIAVFLDVVYNHWGPNDLSVWQYDGWNESGKGGIYFYNDWRSWTEWGENNRPDYGRHEVRQFIRDNALMWLEEYRMDGLRWDATSFIRNVKGNNSDPDNDIPEGWSLMQWINNEVDSRQPWKMNIAEDLKNNDWLTKETGSGGAGFDCQWDAGFVHPVRESIITPNDHERSMYEVRNAIYHSYNGNSFQRVIYTESHDEVANGKARVPHHIWPGNAGSWFSKKRSTIGAALVFTSPGIPMIFQGQEFLEDEWFRDTDPLDWSKQNTYSGILNLYRDLIHLRRNRYNNTRGLRGLHVNVHHVNDNNKVIAFHRWENGGPGDDVIIVINMANRSYDNYNIGFPCQGTWKVRLNSDWSGYSPDFGSHPRNDTTAGRVDKDGMHYNSSIGIGPYCFIILSQ